MNINEESVYVTAVRRGPSGNLSDFKLNDGRELSFAECYQAIEKGEIPSLILDGFAENCSIVNDDCTYTNKVTLEQSEDGEWEIVDFRIELLYAYYGVSMVSVE